VVYFEQPEDLPHHSQWPGDEPVAWSEVLSTRLLQWAYPRGLFPWYNPGEPVLWWSPNPRMVLWPPSFYGGKNLLKRYQRGDFTFSFNRHFARVMEACGSTLRKGQEGGSWIQPILIDCYSELHRQNQALSVEVYRNNELVGGLYGVHLGGVFFGESMFSQVSDASKLALLHLCRNAPQLNIQIIDCQVYTDHLASLGAEEIPRSTFLAHLQQWI
jgi:leucyl/phenylalanyl-tRNA--protein transferase